MKGIRWKGLWIFLVAAVICYTILARSSADIYSITYQADDFIKRYLPDYSYDSTDPKEYVGESEEHVGVFVLRRGALSLRANTYDIGFQYSATDDSTVLKVFSSDYVSKDNSGGKVLLQEPLDPSTTYFKGTFELDQDINSLYIFVETKDQEFTPERVLLESWTPVCTDRYFYCAITMVAAVGIFVLLNYKKAAISPCSLQEHQTNGHRSMLALVFVMAVGVFVASIPLLQQGSIIGHDTPFHLARIEGIASGLASGQFPVRVHGETLNGFGYANSLFYPEALLYIPAVLSLLGVSTITCYKFYMVMVNALTILLSYYAFKKLLNSRYIALTLSIVYLLNPYRLICAYYRNAVGEFTALTFLPLLVYGLYAVLVGNQKDWPCLVAGATGLLQSHILTTEWMAFVSALTVLVFIRQIFTKEKRVLSLVYAGVATVCLNLWFIAPMLLMIISIHPVVFTRVQSPIGFAKYDISYLFHTVTLTGMGPHPIGWVALAAVVGYLLYRILVCHAEDKQKQLRFGDVLAVFCLVSAVATTAYFPWEKLTSLPILGKLVDAIQFPYRLLSIVAICSTVLLGYTILLWTKERSKRVLACLTSVGVAVFCICLLYEFVFVQGDAEKYETKHYYLTNMNNSLCVGQYEYLPTGADLNDMVSYSPKITSTNESLKIDNLSRYGTKMKFDYSMVASGGEGDLIQLPLTYIPNYKILVNGKPVQAVQAESYTVGFIAPEATGTVEVQYKEPVVFRLFEGISVITLVGLCFRERISVFLRNFWRENTANHFR